MRLGCLVLHGLTSSLATVDGLVPYLRARELPYRLPLLRGHGATPDALRGVTWRGWHDDAARALDDLLGECERAVVIGLSMGGVVALHLAAERPERLAGVAAIAPALRLAGTARDQLRVGLAAAANRFIAVDPRNAYLDADLAAASTNYPRAPARTVLSLVSYGRMVERLLPRVRVPLLVVYTPRDRVVDPAAIRSAFDCAGTPPDDKQLVAVDGSGHEMMQDREREAVFDAIMAFVNQVRSRAVAAAE